MLGFTWHRVTSIADAFSNHALASRASLQPSLHTLYIQTASQNPLIRIRGVGGGLKACNPVTISRTHLFHCRSRFPYVSSSQEMPVSLHRELCTRGRFSPQDSCQAVGFPPPSHLRGIHDGPQDSMPSAS
jgi:hypothetical protein